MALTGLLAGCGTDSAPEDTATASSGEALRADFDLNGGELGRVRMEVTTTGPDQIRVRWTTPDDYPPSEINWVYDGKQVLEFGNDPPGYTLYLNPEKSEFSELARALVLPPDSELLARACPEAERLGTRTISGRTALGYACPAEDVDTLAGAREIWVDEITGLILDTPRLKLVRASDAAVVRTTFSTEPPAGVDVKVKKGGGPGASPSEYERTGDHSLARLRLLAGTTPYPVYYLGDEFEGRPLVHVGVSNNRSGAEVVDTDRVRSGQTLFLIYGEDIDMTTKPFSPAGYRGAVGCRRMEPLRGVPTVEQADAVWLFSGDVVIRLGSMAAGYHPELAAPAGAALRLVGQDGPTGADLPPPLAENIELVDEACGAVPGEHGPVGDQ